MKKVTAVLPARNCRQELQKCLSALSRSSYIPGIIVVDDGSDDGTRQMILEPLDAIISPFMWIVTLFTPDR